MSAKSQPTEKPDVPRVKDYDIDFSRMIYMLHLEVDGIIKQADAKAQVLLGLDTFIIAAIASTTAPYLRDIITQELSALSPVQLAGLIITALAIAAQMNSVLFALRTITPRVLRQQNNDHNTFFFGSIARRTPEKYVSDFMNLPLQNVKRDVMLQVHNKSVIIEQKLGTVRVSAQSVLVGVLLWVIALGVLFFSA